MTTCEAYIWVGHGGIRCGRCEEVFWNHTHQRLGGRQVPIAAEEAGRARARWAR